MLLRCSTSIKHKQKRQSNSVSTADFTSSQQHNNHSSLHQKNVRVTNKIKIRSTCNDIIVNSRPYFTKNSFTNHYEMVDRDISTSSGTDVNIYYGNVSTTITAASTNNNNRVDRNSNTIPSSSRSNSSNLSQTQINQKNGNKMTSTTPKSDPTSSITTSNQQGALCDNNNVVTSHVVALGENSDSVTLETGGGGGGGGKKVKKSRKDKERGEKKSRSNPEHKKRRVKVAQTDYSTIERTDAEGAASEDLDFENDPEAAEWAKLRCTSQSTEVVQEREQRRQKRCADYPGLAFGRSVFSSDTLMKFSIIRNELHNIMKSQLKRVKILLL